MQAPTYQTIPKPGDFTRAWLARWASVAAELRAWWRIDRR